MEAVSDVSLHLLHLQSHLFKLRLSSINLSRLVWLSVNTDLRWHWSCWCFHMTCSACIVLPPTLARRRDRGFILFEVTGWRRCWYWMSSAAQLLLLYCCCRCRFVAAAVVAAAALTAKGFGGDFVGEERSRKRCVDKVSTKCRESVNKLSSKSRQTLGEVCEESTFFRFFHKFFYAGMKISKTRFLLTPRWISGSTQSFSGVTRVFFRGDPILLS